MTETPKCPYCGAEMKLHQCGSSIRIWYECECGSESPHISPNWAKDTEESWREAALSAALHRAEPENRPLTLAEVKNHCKRPLEAEPLFMEFKREGNRCRWMLATAVKTLEAMEFTGDYGKSFRCWSRKPSPEQMAAEKWEE